MYAMCLGISCLRRIPLAREVGLFETYNCSVSVCLCSARLAETFTLFIALYFEVALASPSFTLRGRSVKSKRANRSSAISCLAISFV